MGFVRANVLPILKEHKLRPFSGHLLCLGQPDVYFTYEHLLRMSRIADVLLETSVPITLSYKPSFAAKGYISGETLFKSIGFSQVSVLDYSSFEGAEFEFDLNDAALPTHLENRFDAIIDHGTMEHVFHIPNALNNIFRMLRVGGRVIHSAPGENFFDHGFYQFSPTLFYDFYTDNKWELNSIQVFQMTPQQETEPPFFADYEPGLLSSLSYGKMGDRMYGTICIATKTSESTGSLIPQQYIYKQTPGWEKGSSVQQSGGNPYVIKRAIRFLIRKAANWLRS